ncbi:MAG: AMP-binding protein, partial [Rhodopirellula sp. JB055]|uniref:AMP-binding protein n=1 Tax=Rhodopirellula sp. JB055 TaxID=3342846 RepID=UPI003709DA0A
MAELPFNAADDCETLDQACRCLAKRFATHPAFRIDEESIDFRSLDHASDRAAASLRAEGCSPGDRVAIIAKDSIANYELLLACAKSGCVLVPLNWKLSASELANLIRDSQAQVVFADNESAAKLAEHNLPVLSMANYPAWRDAGDNSAPAHVASTNDPVVQIYTSGTTGIPKGVVLAHRTFFDLRRGMRRQGDDWMGLNHNDVLLLSLPQFHIGGLWWAIQGFLVGATGVLMEAFMGWKALELIATHRITQVPMVPAMIQFAMAEPSFATTDLSSVRGFLYGGSPISADLLARARQAFSKADFFQIYGLTETGNMAICLRPSDHEDECLSSATGRPLPGVDCKIADGDGNEVELGETGEIWLRTPSVMLEYWQRPDETHETLVDGWIRTGDAGYRDAAGYLFVCDRVKDMIIYAGENLFPAEIESALQS